MTRAEGCTHYSCDSKCDAAPCNECGWKCPGSTWSLEAAVRNAEAAFIDEVTSAVNAYLAHAGREE